MSQIGRESWIPKICSFFKTKKLINELWSNFLYAIYFKNHHFRIFVIGV